MSRKEKLILKMKNPSSDANWTVAEVVNLLSFSGFKETGGKSSHRVFTSSDRDEAITIAAHGHQIKPGYIRMIRSILNP